MGRVIGAVVVGYVVIFAIVFLSFSAAFLAMKAEGAFRPGSYEVSFLWIAVSFVLGFAAAVAGGFVAALVGGDRRGPIGLAALVLVLGLVFAVPVIMASAEPSPPRPGDVSNMEAMQSARQPAWVALLNPFVGAAGVLLGGRLRRSA